jgi:hypothetical protein
LVFDATLVNNSIDHSEQPTTKVTNGAGDGGPTVKITTERAPETGPVEVAEPRLNQKSLRRPWYSWSCLWRRKSTIIAALSIAQEIIDVLAVLNALRAAFPPKVICDL